MEKQLAILKYSLTLLTDTEAFLNKWEDTSCSLHSTIKHYKNVVFPKLIKNLVYYQKGFLDKLIENKVHMEKQMQK